MNLWCWNAGVYGINTRGQKKDSIDDRLQVSAELSMGAKGLIPNPYTLLDIPETWFLPTYSFGFTKTKKYQLPVAEIIQL